MRWRVGIDVGGTFTDLVAISDRGDVARVKVPSTPRAPERGLLDALAAFVKDVSPDAIAHIGHASTIATNALLGQIHLELPRVGFLTTHGFRDLVEIGRQNRSAVYDLHVRRPKPLAVRDDRIAVRERIAYDGTVLVPLAAEHVRGAIEAIRERGLATVAIGFLNSHRNDAHERILADAIARKLPGVAVTSSSEIVREEREYERFSTAIVNAALVPVVGGYLARIAAGARELGVTAPVSVMQSGGTTAALDAIARFPAALVESGPAAGVIAAAAAGAACGENNILSFDMGGTTAKAGTIVAGKPEIAYEFEAAGTTHSGRASKGSGYPVRFPFVDLAEISAGGGTLARLDAAGVLRVGPLSAGADPGPACYGRGSQPAVTDANVVLGRLNPRALVGGTFPIDAARARDAVASVAAPFGGDPVRAAAAIVALVDADMAKVLRIVSVERGLDPRSFALMAFGGGGPLHACALAEELGIGTILVPEHPGLFSAYGLVAGRAGATRSQSFVEPLDDESLPAAFALADRLEAEARAVLRAQDANEPQVLLEADLRYAGQSFDLTLEVRHGDDALGLVERFHRRHERRYGYAARDERVEIAAVRVTATDASEAFVPRAGAPPVGTASLAFEQRDVWDRDRFVRATVYARECLAVRDRIAGPAIVEQYDTTMWLPSGWTAEVDEHRSLRLERGTT